MKCPYCASSSSKVVDKRNKDDQGVIRRRRECISCKKRYTTYETIENVDLSVLKRSGMVEQFSRDKLTKSIRKAVNKGLEYGKQIAEMVDSIEMDLLHRETTQVKSQEIGEMVLERLKSFDPVGYMRFASVYNNFQTLEDYQGELNKLKKIVRG